MTHQPSPTACLATWRGLLGSERRARRDTSAWEKITPNDASLDSTFVNDWGVDVPESFLAWSGDRVYFPVSYDGAVCVRSVPRQPVALAEGLIAGEAPSSGGDEQ